MVEIDDQEQRILRQLIRNPRISDNKIAKATKIPVMTVNRKRKKLEDENIVRYYTSVDSHESGVGHFSAKQLYVIKLKVGVTRTEYLDKMEKDSSWRRSLSSKISTAYLGEKDGHLAIVLVMDAQNDKELVEQFNGEIVPFIKNKLGKDAIEEIATTILSTTVRVHHNYLPDLNMEKGIMKKNIPDDQLFVPQ